MTLRHSQSVEITNVHIIQKLLVCLLLLPGKRAPSSIFIHSKEGGAGGGKGMVIAPFPCHNAFALATLIVLRPVKSCFPHGLRRIEGRSLVNHGHFVHQICPDLS